MGESPALLRNFSLFIALRYLKPKRTYVSVITLISIAGVTLGVLVLCVVISVMLGFERRLQELILGFEPHVWVTRGALPAGADPFDERYRWETALERAKAVPGVESAAPYMMGQILLQYAGRDGQRRQMAMTMMGVRHEDERVIAEMTGMLAEGEVDFTYDGCLVSKRFANANNLRVGDQLEAFPTSDLQDVIQGFYDAIDDSESEEIDDADFRAQVRELTDKIKTAKDLRITGLYESGSALDVVFLPLYIGQELYEFDFDDEVHGIALRVVDEQVFDIEAMEGALAEAMPPGWGFATWKDQHKQHFSAIKNERVMMYVVLFFIVLVAAFSTMNTMITVTVQKRHEIGVMKALGARVSQIVWAFISQGMIVGAIGSTLGFGLAQAVLAVRNDLREWLADRGVHIFPQDVYGLVEIPAVMDYGAFAIITLGAFVLCTLAALPPAYMVARLDPAKALRE